MHVTACVLQETITVGTGSAADWAPAGPHVAGEHAQLIQKGGRVLCVALQGDEDDLTSRTYTWVNGNEIRKGVALTRPPHSSIS